MENDNFSKKKHDEHEMNPLYAGTYYASSARIEACKDKKYGDDCSWVDENGRIQNGKCVYDKWGVSNGPLFCATRDYRDNSQSIEKNDK